MSFHVPAAIANRGGAAGLTKNRAGARDATNITFLTRIYHEINI